VKLTDWHYRVPSILLCKPAVTTFIPHINSASVHGTPAVSVHTVRLHWRQKRRPLSDPKSNWCSRYKIKLSANDEHRWQIHATGPVNNSTIWRYPFSVFNVLSLLSEHQNVDGFGRQGAWPPNSASRMPKKCYPFSSPLLISSCSTCRTSVKSDFLAISRTDVSSLVPQGSTPAGKLTAFLQDFENYKDIGR